MHSSFLVFSAVLMAQRLSPTCRGKPMRGSGGMLMCLRFLVCAGGMVGMALAEEAGSCDEVTQPLKNGTGDLVGFMQAKISHALQKDSVEKEHVACRKYEKVTAATVCIA